MKNLERIEELTKDVPVDNETQKELQEVLEAFE